MRTITTWIHLLTGLVSLFGLWSVLTSEGGWMDGVSSLASALSGQPWLWAVGVVWAFSVWRARGLGRRLVGSPFRSPGSERSHVLKAAPEASAASLENGSPAGTVAGGVRAVDQEKVRQLRLSALLKGKSPDVPAFVDGLLAEAVTLGAGDVHLQPHEGSGRVTVRIRGERREMIRYPRERHEEVVRRVKVLAGMLPYVSGRAQDGRMSVDLSSSSVQIRASVVPSNHGETVAFRLAGDSSALEIGALGLERDDLESLKRLLAEPQGLLLLTGPTGSGKTTTLYSALEHIHRMSGSTTHLASIEDPVEVELSFVHQIQVDRNRNLGFAQALRSLLRQDPDVLMVGEIRDLETAKVAVQAGLSGHLILTTMHADSAVGVFPRLIDLGVEPFLAGSAVVGCVSQRLERRLCETCRHPRSLVREQREKLRALGVDDDEKTFFTAEGCSSCSGSGFQGRTALFEVLTLDQELRRLVASKAAVSRLEQESRRRGAGSLWVSALAAAERGEIPLDRALIWAGSEAR